VAAPWATGHPAVLNDQAALNDQEEGECPMITAGAHETARDEEERQ
jgi:hypothetical protein